MTINELYDKAYKRYNRWQKIYERTGEVKAQSLMYYYAGQVNVLLMLIMDSEGVKNHEEH